MSISIESNVSSSKDKTEDSSVFAVVYARYSSHNQTEQSIEGQLAAAYAYAEIKGYTIIHEYIDRAKTGRNDNRDDFQLMLSDCAKKKFQVIIVWKVDRFGRNREEITFNKYRAKKHGVRVEYVAENLPETPEAVILESVLEGMAEYYSLQLSQNVKRGLRENFKKGRVLGGRLPLGYRVGADKTYEVNPETAVTVRSIFEMYVRGDTCAEIAARLNAQGLRTAQGHAFTKNSIRAILENEKYIGVYTYKGEDESMEGAIPPIIDREVFEKVREKLKTNRRAPSKTWNKSDYILTDKLFCGHCGSPMAGESGFSRNGSKHSYYLCGSHKRKKGCPKRAIRQNYIEDLVLRFTLDLLYNDELLNEVIERTWAYYAVHSEDDSKERTIQAQLSNVNTSIKNLLRAVEAGFFTEATRERMTELEAQKTALESTLAELSLSESKSLTRDKLEFFLLNLRNMDYSDRECQKRLISTFINSIYAYDDYLIINYNYSTDGRLIRFDQMEAILRPNTDDWFDPSATLPAITRTLEPFRIKWFECVVCMKVWTKLRPP